MIGYIFKRLLNIIPVFFGITLISFMVIHLSPGKPTELMMELNPKAAHEAQERMEEIFGLDQPLYIQYFRWLKNIFIMDFGVSFVDGRPVAEKIKERMPITILINVLAIVVIMGAALPIGIKSAVERGSLYDRLSTVFVFICFAIPSVWLALMLMSTFGLRLGWFPVSGIYSLDFENFSPIGKVLDVAHHLALPVVVASIGGLAGFSRYMRQSMLNVLDQDYIRTARAKGLPEDIVIKKHALGNALLPIVTILGLSIPGLISGSVIFESIFNIPGMGRLMVESVFTRDYNTIMAGLVLSAFLTLAGNLLADIAYFYIDPRIRQ
jgi:peptide/nickel transport system permease protein